MRRAVFLLIVLVALACRDEKRAPGSANPDVENKVTTRPVTLFFEAPDMLLAAERREVAMPENPAAAASVVIRELLKGSASAAVPRLFPEDTVLRAAYLLPDGTVVVDLGGQTLTDGWSTGTHQELMAVYSMVQTLATNFSEARRVRILLNGTPAETLGGPVWLGRPLVPVQSLVRRTG